MGYRKENLKNGGCYISNLDAWNLKEAAEALFDYLTELFQPIADFYDQHPQKALDKTSWESSEVETVNLWKDARLAAFVAKRDWKKTRAYYGPGEW